MADKIFFIHVTVYVKDGTSTRLGTPDEIFVELWKSGFHGTLADGNGGNSYIGDGVWEFQHLKKMYVGGWDDIGPGSGYEITAKNLAGTREDKVIFDLV